MALLKNLFGRLGTNIGRVIEDVAPIASAAAPFLVPGIGGFAISQGLDFLTRQRATPIQSAMQQAVRTQRACPPAGMVGGGFSGPFQSNFFSSGVGGLAGRGLQARFQPQVMLGRASGGCPSTCPSSCRCPGQSRGPSVGTFAGQLQAASPQPVAAAVVQPPPKLPEIRSALRVNVPDFGSAFRF